MKKNQTRYVDGFVLVVPKDKVAEYRKMAAGAKKMWMSLGALDYKECMGDDLAPAAGGGMQSLSFTELAKANENETVWFSYITYKSKAHRNQVNKKVMADMDKNTEKYKDMPMPFDTKRMAFGGFKVVVSA